MGFYAIVMIGQYRADRVEGRQRTLRDKNQSTLVLYGGAPTTRISAAVCVCMCVRERENTQVAVSIRKACYDWLSNQTLICVCG